MVPNRNFADTLTEWKIQSSDDWWNKVRWMPNEGHGIYRERFRLFFIAIRRRWDLATSASHEQKSGTRRKKRKEGPSSLIYGGRNSTVVRPSCRRRSESMKLGGWASTSVLGTSWGFHRSPTRSSKTTNSKDGRAVTRVGSVFES